jgi:hypothetical protein
MPNIAIRCCSEVDTSGRTAFTRAPWTMHICGQRCATSSATRCAPDCAPPRRTGPGRARRRTSDGRRRHLGSICLPGDRGLRLGEWEGYLAADTFSEAEAALRLNTYSGRPLGTDAFVARLEVALGRKLRPGKGGRPRAKPAETTAVGSQQGILIPKG